VLTIRTRERNYKDYGMSKSDAEKLVEWCKTDFYSYRRLCIAKMLKRMKERENFEK
jgi:hypothetical protein